MRIVDFFNREGQSIIVAGNKPQMLDDIGSVWLVAQGKISVFLTALTGDNKPGTKTFLFEAEQGDIIFGMTPEGITEKEGLLARGLAGSRLIRLEINELRTLLAGELKEEVVKLVEHWLRTLTRVSNNEKIFPAEFSETKEKPSLAYDYLNNSKIRDNYHCQFLRSVAELWEQQKQTEKIRLQRKTAGEKRHMANAVSLLASLNHKKKTDCLQASSGNQLLDTCRLIGRSMHIEIVAPSWPSDELAPELNLDAIARASRIRTREVTLQGKWYQQDHGPILGFMKEDDRAVALIPESPSRYVLHDPASNTEKIVDRDTAAQIKHLGFIFYRPLANGKIKLRDLLLWGCQVCWKRDLAIIGLMGILGGLLGTAIPLATGIVFNSIIPESEKSQLLQVAFILGATALANMLFQFTRSLATLRLEGKMDSSLQAAVWDRLLSLPVPFFKQFAAGDLAMRATGISQIRMILSGTTLNTIFTSIFSVFTFALLFYYDTRLAGAAALLAVIAILVMGFLGYRQVSYERKALEISNNITGMMLQLIGAVTKFRVAGAENRAFHRWAYEFARQRKLDFKRKTIGNYLITFNAFFPVLSSMVIFYALTSAAQPLSTGQFVAFNSAFITFMLSLVSLSESLISTNLVIPLYQRIKPILETLPEDDETKINPQQLTGSIEVSHVSFRYKDDAPLVLQDVSLQINEGDYAALVGPSGCGKSTLLRILLGFERPETGEVYYNGQDLSKVDARAVRRQLGVVLQNGQLMSGSIFSNIVGANPHLTINDAWEAARMAGIDEDIRKMPMGMHTMISEGAATISGGQKQRLMIARAVINKPRIIFFDEATSALDNNTQAIVSQSLDELQTTRVVIAHRLSTIMKCNKIFVMDQGKIVEQGDYQMLMDKQGFFADMAKRQLA